MERKSVAVLEKINGFKNGGFLFDISLKCSHCGENVHVSDADYFDIDFQNIARCSACNQDTVIDFSDVKPVLDDCVSEYENHTFLITDGSNYNFASRLVIFQNENKKN